MMDDHFEKSPIKKESYRWNGGGDIPEEAWVRTCFAR
jgi:hypothetical protein